MAFLGTGGAGYVLTVLVLRVAPRCVDVGLRLDGTHGMPHEKCVPFQDQSFTPYDLFTSGNGPWSEPLSLKPERGPHLIIERRV